MGDVEHGAANPLRPYEEAAKAGLIPETLLEVSGMQYAVGEKVLLEEVSVVFQPRHLTALMGPSGAGKTTLMNVISGRAGGKILKGGVLVNGAPTTPKKLRLLMSYMPQEDVLYPSLTVKQTLYYSSFLRCPEKWSREAKTERVDVILSKLNLKHVENGIVGDHTTKGSISGGQKRRLSAAIEFLSFRPVMLMDEPTSGLDSPSAMTLVKLLHDAATDQGRTVICTIHQPSWSIVCLFDPLVLLGAGGKQIYDGPVPGLPAFFADGGAPCPESENPADHALYVLARGDTDGWHAKWKAASKPAPAETVPFEDDEREDSEQDYPISFMTQYRLLLLRSVHIWVCDPSQGPLVWGMTVFSTIMYASAYFSLHDSVSRELAIITFVMFIYQAASTPLCVVMPLERAVVLRDYRNGVFSTAPYWLARATLACINGAIISFLACAIVYPCLSFTFKNAMIPFKFFVMTTLLMSCCMLLGLIIGISSPSALAAIKIVPPSLVFQLLTCQVLVPQNQFPAYLLPAKYINLLTWSVKYLMVEVFAHTSDKADTYLTSNDFFDISKGNADSCIPMMILLFALLFCAGFVVTTARLNKADDGGGGAAAAPKPATATATPVPEEKQVEKAAAASPLTEALLEEPGGGDYGSTEEPKLCASRLDAKPVSLRAHAITLWRDVHSADKKATLHDVSVSFEAKTTTALMGPSGAGKTTLIDVLTGRTLENDLVEGVVTVNGRELPKADFKYFTTVTPQEDILLADLTVRDILYFTAELRCAGDMTQGEKRARADEVIAQLGLQAKADVVVGSTEKPGISGGQKKRVSIGMDLLANCSVMCLDEPTTGLDAAAALSIADVVMSLAKVTGRTMVCTIHQPTWELISRFDQLTILVQGRLAFCEQPAQLAPFFAGGGHPCPDNENPIDFAMYRLQDGSATVWTDLWRRSAAAKARATETLPADAFAEPASRAGDYDAVFGRYPTSAATQYWILLKRCTLSYLKDEDQSVEHVMPSLMQALVTGLVYLNFSTNLYLATGMCFGVMGACMIAFNAFLLNIPFEKALIVREYKNGSYGAAAYWASRMTLASVSAACVAFVTPFIWWPLMGLPLNEPSRVVYAALAIAITAASYASLASLAGVVMPDAVAAAQTSEPIISLLTLTGGTMLTRPQIKVYWMWLYYLNPLHYCYEIVVTQGFQGRHGSHKPEDTLDYFHYGNGHMGANFTWLITIYVVIAAAGFIVVPRFMGH
ncbi:ATPase [Aureococcus anophagefferens]|uniref:ATPase n=1 Tax=Aureococcus anophagefferens TaxID=44056 RepID=A0ABR1GAS9_AURAN